MVRAILCLLALATALSLGCFDEEAPEAPGSAPQEQTSTATAVPPSPTPAPTATATPAPTATPVPTPTPAPTATAEPVSWEERLSEAFKRMGEVESLHFEVEMELALGSADSRFVIPLTFEGSYVAPDRIRGVLRVTLGFFEVESETVVIGNAAYVTNPETGLWERGGADSLPVIDPTDVLSEAALIIEDLSLKGTDTIGGVPVFRVGGTVPAEPFLADDVGDLQIEYWITEGDWLIRRVTMEGEFEGGADILPLAGPQGPQASGSTTMQMTMTLSDFGDPVTIEAPEVGAPRSR